MQEEMSLQVTEHEENWFGSWFRWCPTSLTILREAEKSILSSLKKSYRGKYVNVGKVVGKSESSVWTVCMNEESENTPIVLLHGFGAGVGLWCLNLDSLAANRPVYAVDILGFGRSSRPKFNKDPLEAESEFVSSIDAWRQEMSLNKFILLGHSFGGFLAAAYAIKHPDRISHLILADPWGFPEQPLDADAHHNESFWFKAIVIILTQLNPLFIVRTAGPLGPKLMEKYDDKYRPGLIRKFTPLVLNAERVMPNYMYHCNAQDPSGETAFHSIMVSFEWAKHPMINRIDSLKEGVPITLVYGSQSWIDSNSGYQIKYSRMDSFVDIQVIVGVGHHIYAESAEVFNKLVNNIGEHVDNGTLPPIFP